MRTILTTVALLATLSTTAVAQTLSLEVNACEDRFVLQLETADGLTWHTTDLLSQVEAQQMAQFLDLRHNNSANPVNHTVVPACGALAS